jgi:hypothetical protein
MANSPDVNPVLAALARLKAGNTQLADFERFVGAVIAAGTLTRADVRGALDAAVVEGTLQPDTLSRLGLDARESSGTVYRSSSGPASRDASACATELRSISPQRSGQPSPAEKETASVWIEPDPLTAGGSVTTGQLLGHRYLLERELGEGGMGVVYFATDQDVKGECFAIKVLKPEIREHPDSLELLREEVRKTRALHHPNIVGVYSLNSDRSGVYMLMEYLEGKTLSALIDEEFGRGMPLIRAWPLIKDIGAALAYAHDHSVIHSDLKPPNVFVTTSGRAVLMDFGIARAVRGHTGRFDPAVLGALTPAYASCEMLEGRPPDQSDDVYAFACVIYEMLTGKHPFDRRTALEARAAGLRPARIASLTRGQNAALARALAYERAKRTISVEVLLAGLEGATAGATPRLTWFAVGIVCFIVVGVAAWFVVSRLGAAKPTPIPEAGFTVPGAGDVQARMRALSNRAERAKKLLAVDTSQRAWQLWSQQFEAARQSLAARDPNVIRRLSEADSTLTHAIASGDRWMKIGSLPPEIDEAVTLCRRSGGRCSQSDFAGEIGRMAQLRPFELDPTEITNREFAEFATATGYATQAERVHGLYDYAGKGPTFRSGESWKTLRDAVGAKGIDTSDYPVRGIDFETAEAFCDWRHRRLPTGDEWEFVARGVERHIFPWGNDPKQEIRATRLLPVIEQEPTGRFGNRGLGGALWEWVDDGTPTQRVLRGASWLDRNPVNQRLAMRRLEDPTHAYVDTGFRCARTMDAWPDRAR